MKRSCHHALLWLPSHIFALSWQQRRASLSALSQSSCGVNSVELSDAEEKPALQSLHPEQQRGMQVVQST